jgi:hypothetical protein
MNSLTLYWRRSRSLVDGADLDSPNLDESRSEHAQLEGNASGTQGDLQSYARVQSSICLTLIESLSSVDFAHKYDVPWVVHPQYLIRLGYDHPLLNASCPHEEGVGVGSARGKVGLFTLPPPIFMANTGPCVRQR